MKIDYLNKLLNDNVITIDDYLHIINDIYTPLPSRELLGAITTKDLNTDTALRKCIFGGLCDDVRTYVTEHLVLPDDADRVEPFAKYCYASDAEMGPRYLWNDNIEQVSEEELWKLVAYANSYWLRFYRNLYFDDEVVEPRDYDIIGEGKTIYHYHKKGNETTPI